MGSDRHDVAPKGVATYSVPANGGTLPPEAILGQRLVDRGFLLASGLGFVQPNPIRRSLWDPIPRRANINLASKTKLYKIMIDGDEHVVALIMMGDTEYVRSIRRGALTEYYDIGVFSRASPEFIHQCIYSPQFLRDEGARAARMPTLSVRWSDAFMDPLFGNTRVQPGLLSVLHRLREGGVRLVLWADSSEDLVRHVLATEPGLANVFERVITSEDFKSPSTNELAEVFEPEHVAHISDYLKRYPQALLVSMLGHFGLLGDSRALSLDVQRDPFWPYWVHLFTPDPGEASATPARDALIRNILSQAEIFRHPQSEEYKAALTNAYFSPTAAWRRALRKASPRPGVQLNVDNVFASKDGPRLSAEPLGIMMSAADYLAFAPYFPADATILILSNTASHFHLKVLGSESADDGKNEKAVLFEFNVGLAMPNEVRHLPEAIVTFGVIAGKTLFKFLESAGAPESERWSSPTVMLFTRLFALFAKNVDAMWLVISDALVNPELWRRLGFERYPGNPYAVRRLVGRQA